MKKLLLTLTICALALSLVACRKDGSDRADAKPTPTPNWSDVLAASASDAANAKTPPASATDATAQPTVEQTPEVKAASAPATAQDAYEKARACIGLSVQELYDAVGQPTGEPVYGPSCLQVDAEDGMLPYDGFSVWTVRSADAETVHDVYLNE